MSLTLLSRNHEAQTIDRLHFKAGDEVLMLVAVAAVHALSVHHGKLIVQMAIEEVAISHQSHIAAIVDTVKRIGTFTGEIEHRLRVDVDELELRGRQRILQRVAVLELSQTHGQRLVVGETVVGVVFLYDAREVVHEEERPAVGDARLCPEQGTLQVEVVAVGVVCVLPGVTRLRITVESDTTGDVLHPVGFLLRHRRTTAQSSKCNREHSSFQVLSSHCYFCIVLYPVAILFSRRVFSL